MIHFRGELSGREKASLWYSGRKRRSSVHLYFSTSCRDFLQSESKPSHRLFHCFTALKPEQWGSARASSPSCQTLKPPSAISISSPSQYLTRTVCTDPLTLTYYVHIQVYIHLNMNIEHSSHMQHTCLHSSVLFLCCMFS